MKNIFVISYDCDNLGDYFKKCNEDLQYFINSKKFSETVIHCKHNLCNRENLHNELKKHNENYLVVIYAHGDKDKIIDNNKNDIINIDDAMNYNNAIVYSSACYSAEELGKKMHLYTCQLFYGYFRKAYIVSLYKETFIELDNFALKEILQDEDIEPIELCKKIDKYFDARIEEMSSINKLVTPLLMHNRESYKIYKNKEEYPK